LEKAPSLQSKLAVTFMVVWLGVVLLLTAVLTLSFYLRDVSMITTQVREKAILMRTGLLSTMMATGSPEVVKSTINAFKNEYKSSLKIRMIESGYIWRQFGSDYNEKPRDQIEADVLSGKLPEFSDLSGTKFRFITPFVTDERCGRCHQDMDGKPIATGKVNGIAEFVYDVSAWKESSLRLLAETEFFLILILGVNGFAIYNFLSKNVLRPISDITNAITVLEKEEQPRLESTFATTKEIMILMNEVQRMADTIAITRAAHAKELEEERKKNELISKFVTKQADRLGVTNMDDISFIINRLSVAVSEVEKAKMLEVVAEFVTQENKVLTIGNDVLLTRPISLYLTDLIAGKKGAVKKGSIELALEEAITNAIAHGNLGLESHLKDDDTGEFERMMEQRIKMEPYASRKVHISYGYSGDCAVFTIQDEGSGFNWKEYLKKEPTPELLSHGRGLFIIRAFASSVVFDEKGTRITIKFDI
jgi:anti-sigma regulatory factor (Ser/Thr protein kinase)